MKTVYYVQFWEVGFDGTQERFTNKRHACAAIAEYIRDQLDSLPHLRQCFRRVGSAYRDGSVTVFHKAGGREFGAYLCD